MYGYTEMEAFVTYFDTDSWVSAHSVVGIYTDFVLWQQILNSLEWTISVSRSQRQESFFNLYPLVSKLYSIAVIQPLSTAEVKRLFSHVCLHQNQPQS
jgi:hypothetical protein